MIDPDAPLHIGMVYGVVGTLAAIAAIMVFIVWVVPAILLAVEWVKNGDGKMSGRTIAILIGMCIVGIAAIGVFHP